MAATDWCSWVCLLGVSYQLYQHTETNKTVVHTVGYLLPVALHVHVQTVAPMMYFTSLHMLWQALRRCSGGAAAGLVKAVLGKLVVALLGCCDVVSCHHSCTGCTSCLPTSLWQWTRMCLGLWDMSGSSWAQQIWGRSWTISTPIGTRPPSPSYRSTTVGTAWMTLASRWTWMSSTLRPWHTHTSPGSTTYSTRPMSHRQSACHMHYEKYYPLDYARTVCDLFLQLGMCGISVLFATGGYGVSKGDCKTNGIIWFMPTISAACTCDVFFCLQAVHECR